MLASSPRGKCASPRLRCIGLPRVLGLKLLARRQEGVELAAEVEVERLAAENLPVALA